MTFPSQGAFLMQTSRIKSTIPRIGSIHCTIVLYSYMLLPTLVVLCRNKQDLEWKRLWRIVQRMGAVIVKPMISNDEKSPVRSTAFFFFYDYDDNNLPGNTPV